MAGKPSVVMHIFLLWCRPDWFSSMLELCIIHSKSQNDTKLLPSRNEAIDFLIPFFEGGGKQLFYAHAPIFLQIYLLSTEVLKRKMGLIYLSGFFLPSA